MKTIITTAAASLGMMAAQAQTNWKVDASHSKLGFSVLHMMVTETEGYFKIFDGNISSKSDIDFTDASISFTADVNSINTNDEKRDGHLKSPDFFDAPKFPSITFKAASIKPDASEKNAYTIDGDLTMHGITKKIKLQAIGASAPVKDPYGNIKYGFNVTGKINRKEFDLKWNVALEAGGVLVSENVNLKINIELVKVQSK